MHEEKGEINVTEQYSKMSLEWNFFQFHPFFTFVDYLMTVIQ
jgi:hypothetical protein